jgi:hypothetical protein
MLELDEKIVAEVKSIQHWNGLNEEEEANLDKLRETVLAVEKKYWIIPTNV